MAYIAMKTWLLVADVMFWDEPEWTDIFQWCVAISLTNLFCSNTLYPIFGYTWQALGYLDIPSIIYINLSIYRSIYLSISLSLYIHIWEECVDIPGMFRHISPPFPCGGLCTR